MLWAPMHDTGSGGAHFAPARFDYSYDCWEAVILRDHPQQVLLLSHLKDGLSAFHFFVGKYQGTSTQSPCRPDAFPGASLPNRIPAAHADFVRTKMAALVKVRCLI